MLLAISSSVHRLRMSSLEYHGDATSSKPESTLIIQSGVSSVAMSSDVTPIAVKNRPKLSIQTSSLPSPYVKSSKGVLGSTSTVSGAATPTTSNTISNASQAISLRPSPTTPKPFCNRPSQNRNYTQPIGLRSILKHGPESPKCGMKRSHSVFSADSSSPHMTRRTFFPAAKKVIFESDEKLAVAIPFQASLSSPDPTPSGSQTSISAETTPSSDKASNEQAEGDITTTTVLPRVRGAPRTRNGTPPPAATPSGKKRKVRRWEWTITSPRPPTGDDSSEKPPKIL